MYFLKWVLHVAYFDFLNIHNFTMHRNFSIRTYRKSAYLGFVYRLTLVPRSLADLQTRFHRISQKRDRGKIEHILSDYYSFQQFLTK